MSNVIYLVFGLVPTAEVMDQCVPVWAAYVLVQV